MHSEPRSQGRPLWRQVPGDQILVGAASLVLCMIPLFNLLAFEFSAAMGAVLAYVAGWQSCGAAYRARQASFPRSKLLHTLGRNLSLLPLPLVIMSIHSNRVPTCDWSGGLAFYATFTIPAIIYGTCLGFLLGLIWQPRRARMFFILWSLATYLWGFIHLVRQPPIFAFNAFIGFFPGPIYDHFVPLSGRLLLTRAALVVQAVFFLSFAHLGWHLKRFSLLHVFSSWRGDRAAFAVAWILCGMALSLYFLKEDALGIRVHRQTIQAQLAGHRSTAHTEIYFASEAYSPSDAQELADEHEFHYFELSRFFELELDTKIGSYVYATADQKKQLMGAAGTSFEDAINDEFHINANRFPHPVLRHEMAHMFAAHIDRWKPINPRIGLHEGIAVAAEWSAETQRLGLTPHEACVAMQAMGVLPEIGKLLSAFGFWTQASSRAYTAAGSFVKFLIDEFGIQSFRQLWSNGSFDQTYGHDLDFHIQKWKASCLSNITLSPMQLRRAELRYRAPAIFAVPCAHEQARLQRQAAEAIQSGSNGRAAQLYRQLLEIEPTRLHYRLQGVRAQMRLGETREALEQIQDFLDQDDLLHADRYRGLELLGHTRWQLNDHARADSAYAQAREEAAFRTQRRSLAVYQWALNDTLLRDSLTPYLTDMGLQDASSLALLSQLRIKKPNHALPRYLLARRLYSDKQFDEALSEFKTLLETPALRSTLPADVTLACIELASLSALRNGNPKTALRLLDLLQDPGPMDRDPAGPSLENAERLRLEAWRSRARWMISAMISAKGQ